ncbi:hypothetical protein QQP08_008081 [Theobroma cacao]|nr:hypothetical protein QQP08_008081 [Theobroma cacao]
MLCKRRFNNFSISMYKYLPSSCTRPVQLIIAQGVFYLLLRMEQRTKATNISITLLLTILISSSSVHSRKLAGSPSPSPINLELIARMRRPGSLPLACHSKCNQCKPCMPVEVSIRAAEFQEHEYYPQVWQCICQENIYPP